MAGVCGFCDVRRKHCKNEWSHLTSTHICCFSFSSHTSFRLLCGSRNFAWRATVFFMAWDLVWYFLNHSACSWFLLSLISSDFLWRKKKSVDQNSFKKEKFRNSYAKIIQFTWWPCRASSQRLWCMWGVCLGTVMLRPQVTYSYWDLILVPMNERGKKTQ